MKKRVSSIRIPQIDTSIGSIPENSERFIDKSFDISNRIIYLMRKKNWIQKDLAESMGKSEAEISKLLSGTHNFTLRMLSNIEAVFQDDLITILSDKPERKEKKTYVLLINSSKKMSSVDEILAEFYAQSKNIERSSLTQSAEVSN
jgi:transcriptional regulator with XRE-family HTH domain